ncbi:MAG: N-acetylglucosaminidase [Senegalia sp. (in: firmicutes)]|uniref:N-acetylglucosaminidase n=1 Tax=Senegalia sp. (in: firmicutes) TaxID=1924098 RepID=UPI003F99E89A
MEGYELYPGDKQITRKLEYVANSLLKIGKGHHGKSNFERAISYYNDILNLPEISQSIIKEVEKYKNVANKKIRYRTLEEILELGSKEYTASGKKEIYMEGYELYPGDEQIKKRLVDTALGLLKLGRNYHSSGNFNIAISYYNDILNISMIPDSVKTEVNLALSLAQRKIVLNSNNFYMTEYNISLRESLNKQLSLGGAYPRTDLLKYANTNIPKDKYGWYAANSESILNHMDSKKFINSQDISNDIFQFVVLSVSTGLDPKDLNQILFGQGILENMGSAFAQASKLHSINELYLISHAKLETGNGFSTLANGVYVDEDYKLVDESGYFINTSGVRIGSYTSKSYKKVYNMFGIGAFDSNPLMGGAIRAYKEGWDTPAKAIIGGAKFINNGYISRGQDTLYKMRWNPDNPGVHQYATDIGWAIKQAKFFASFYNKCSDYTLVFDIPQYRN